MGLASLGDGAAWAEETSIVLLVVGCGHHGPIDASSLVEPGPVDRRFHCRDALSGDLGIHLFDGKLAIVQSFAELFGDGHFRFHGAHGVCNSRAAASLNLRIATLFVLHGVGGPRLGQVRADANLLAQFRVLLLQLV